MDARTTCLRTALGADVVVLVFGWVSLLAGLPLALAGGASAAFVVWTGRRRWQRASARVLGALTALCVGAALLGELGVLGAASAAASEAALLAIPYLVGGMLVLAGMVLGARRPASAPPTSGSILHAR